MSVLGKLTDEYFGKDARTEDGKFLEIRGFKVLVPSDFTEEVFFEALKDFFKESEANFLRKENTDIRYTNIPCGNGDFYLSLRPFEEIGEYLSYTFSNKQIESILKFIEFLFDGVNIDSEHGKYCIVLLDTSDFDYEIYEAGMDVESQDCWDDMLEMFFEDFKDAEIDKDDLHYIQYYNTNLNIRICKGEENEIIIKAMLYAKDMVKWWKEQIDEIRKQGARQYFGYDFEEEE